MSSESLPQQAVKSAMRDIGRLISFGWIDDLTDDAVQRMQNACQRGDCPEIWDEFTQEHSSFFRRTRGKTAKTPLKNVRSKKKQLL